MQLVIILLLGIGLLYIDASIWQMLRGSLIVFAGILSVCFVLEINFIYAGFIVFLPLFKLSVYLGND